MTIEIGLGQTALNNTATVDFTSAKLTSAPVGVLGLLSLGSANGTAAPDANPSIGSTDGTGQSGFTHRNDDGLASVQAAREFQNTFVLASTPQTSDLDEVSHNSFLSNGWRANHSDRDNAGYLALAAMFGGSDVAAESGTFSLSGTTQQTITLNNTGLTPNVIFFYTACNSIGGGGSFYVPSFGIAVDNGTSIVQRQFSWHDQDGNGSGDPRAGISTSHCVRQKAAGSSGFNWQTTLDSISAGQFKVTSDSNPGGDDAGYLALQIDNANVDLVDVDLPTATGLNEQTGPGFQPSFVMQVLSMLTAADTDASDASAGAFAVSLFNDTEAFTYSWSIEDAAATTNTQSLAHNKAVHFDKDDGTLAFDATFSQFTANGWELNYSTVDATVRKGFALAIGEAGGGATSASTTENAVGQDAFSVLATSPNSLTENSIAVDTYTAITNVASSLTEGISAGDSDSDTTSAISNITETSTGNDLVDAVAQVSASIADGAKAGESWVAQAQTLVSLVENGAAGETLTNSAADIQSAAISENSVASNTFVAAVQTVGSITESASATDSIITAITAVCAITENAVAQSSFSTGSTKAVSILENVQSQSVYSAVVKILSSFTGSATVSDLIVARSSVQSSITVNAIAGDSWVTRDKDKGYLIVSAITLTSVLSSTPTLDPAIHGPAVLTPALSSETNISPKLDGSTEVESKLSNIVNIYPKH